MASNPVVAMASTLSDGLHLEAMASTLEAMASNPVAMASLSALLGSEFGIM